MSRPSDPWRLGLLAALGLALNACTTVKVVDRDGAVTVSRHLLTVGVRLEASERSQALQLRGVGYFASPLETAFGAYRTELVALGDDCRAVFWLASPEQAAELTKLIDFNRICLAQPWLTSEVSK